MSHLLKICIRLAWAYISVFLKIQSSPLNFVTFLIGFCCPEYWFLKLLWLGFVFLIVSPDVNLRVFHDFQGALPVIIVSMGNFAQTRGRLIRECRQATSAGQATSGGSYHHQGSPTGPFRGFFSLSLCALFLFAQLSSEDQILLHLVQNNLALLFLCTLHS